MTESSGEIWVTVTEGAEITGYNRDYVKKLVVKVWKQPEEDRLIKLRRRSYGYEIWLPDLIEYSQNIGRGPLGSRDNTPEAEEETS